MTEPVEVPSGGGTYSRVSPTGPLVQVVPPTGERDCPCEPHATPHLDSFAEQVEDEAVTPAPAQPIPSKK